ncbi:peptide-methionine (S)-S-oxide reductase MsrA [Candidatus Persebacteraceae bacterium Df01]|jgi:peptide-methionine (S)-S-oxide reductase|uniref:Peptide methionine sulfoxide reductase MsrA n=1 Tax=Candidatus Doriopsillibacter californiensis TaxID=2970740 RepID=A0ABT7QKE1_9GAMM|nr:peptide-methionine (S)-S-oxide reductase MsrA [Candidatus Persebacteraceae bacterium Df01]
MSEKAIFAAGCFWGVEATFQNITGVSDSRVGYIGGTISEPTYKQVCAGDTGHAEAIEIIFNPQTVPYEELLAQFWQLHDPTQQNRQGPDVGSQYRSAIFYLTDAQRRAAEQSKIAAQAGFSRPIATQITAADTFWPAEDYHQSYVQKRRGGFFS